MVLDCPLFKQACIVLDDWSIVLHSADMFAPVGLLHPTAFHLEPKVGISHAKGLLANHTQQTQAVSDEQQLSEHAAQLSLELQQPASSATQSSTSLEGHSGGSVTPAEIMEVPQGFPHAVYTAPDTVAADNEAAPEHQVRQHEQQHIDEAEPASKRQQAVQSSAQHHAALDSSKEDKGPCSEVEGKGSAAVSSAQHAAQADHSAAEPDDFLLDVQLQQGKQYTRVVCCLSSEATTELTGQGTAKALNNALQAISKGALLPRLSFGLLMTCVLQAVYIRTCLALFAVSC